jgi:large subunit ribosomal protein L24
MKIKKGDTVVVIAGKDKGNVGKVLEAYPAQQRVLVDGVNIISRHTKPKSAQDKGGIIKKAAPIHVSNVMIYENGTATRVAYKMLNGKKVRVSVKSGQVLDKEFVKAAKKEAKAQAKADAPKAKETKAKVAKAEKPAKEAKATTTKKVAEKKTTVRKTVGNSGK